VAEEAFLWRFLLSKKVGAENRAETGIANEVHFQFAERLSQVARKKPRSATQ
jgi:hypothetical protein